MRRSAAGPTTDTHSSSRSRSISSTTVKRLKYDEFISKTFAGEWTSIDQSTEMRMEHAALDRFSRKFPVTPCQREVSSVDDDDNKKPKFIDVHSDLDWKRYQVVRPSLWTTFVVSEKHPTCIFWPLHQIMCISTILHERRRKTFICRRYYRGPRNGRYRSVLCGTRSPLEEHQCFRHYNSQPNQGFSATFWLPRGWLWNVKLGYSVDILACQQVSEQCGRLVTVKIAVATWTWGYDLGIRHENLTKASHDRKRISGSALNERGRLFFSETYLLEDCTTSPHVMSLVAPSSFSKVIIW